MVALGFEGASIAKEPVIVNNNKEYELLVYDFCIILLSYDGANYLNQLKVSVPSASCY